MGYIINPYQFYFEAGENTITMEGVNEPMVLKKLTLAAIDDSVTYEEYLANCPGEGNSETNINYVQVVQGEDSTIRSESSLYAKYDKSAPNTQPYSVTNTILNYVGRRNMVQCRPVDRMGVFGSGGRLLQYYC